MLHETAAGLSRAETLQEALARCGCAAEAGEFRRLVRSWFGALHPRHTAGDFGRRSRHMKRFCAVMRAVFACEALPDDLIALALATEPD